eukprot:28380-Eustigmatos_ZCMA.PRE.1
MSRVLMHTTVTRPYLPSIANGSIVSCCSNEVAAAGSCKDTTSGDTYSSFPAGRVEQRSLSSTTVLTTQSWCD